MAESKKFPSSIPFIMGNEMAERFSYYGMKAFLTIYMTKYLMDSQGNLAPMDDKESNIWFHLFVSANYFFPLIGALLADVFWGKYKTIFSLSIVYCLGHLMLSIDDTRLGLGIGLALIAMGSGGIKPCVSANVGDQFNESNKELIPKVFNFFYLSINFGSLISTIFTPILLKNYGPSVAFGVPGILMFIATVIFWLGRSHYVVIPPTGPKKFAEEVLNKESLTAIARLIPIYLFMSVFWSLYEQTGSSWVKQADYPNMDKVLNIFGYTFTVDASQVQALNPLLVLILVPTFAYVIFPFLEKRMNVTALGKISVGFFFTALSFIVMAYMETRLNQGETISIMWQGLVYVILTTSEILIYGTGLEFSYRQAPPAAKSLVMGLFLMAVTVGNLFTAGINALRQHPDFPFSLDGANYYWFFTTIMLVAAVAFIPMVFTFKEKSYIRQ